MSSRSFSPLTTLWRKWKTLNLPWRRRWLAGTDLAGNTFWYFKPSLATPRPRRILQNNAEIPYSDIDISPAWHQWLRGTRPSPPSLQEQHAEVQRQRDLKQLARAADERWAAKPSVLDRPGRGIMEVGVEIGKKEGPVGRSWEEGKRTGAVERVEGERSKGEKRENPWGKSRAGNPGEAWQPESWKPGGGKR